MILPSIYCFINMDALMEGKSHHIPSVLNAVHSGGSRRFKSLTNDDYGNMYLTYMPSSVQLLPQVTVDSVHLVLQSVKLHSSGGQSLWRWNIYDHLSN